MKKVVYLPLDERPCNLKYPQDLAAMTDLKMVVPDQRLLGDMKRPADVPLLHKWLREESKSADYLIVSIDMLIYGGIVPSRLHHLSIDECQERLEVLRTIQDENPHIKIYAYNLIMRVPAYSSSEEEPDYYEHYGEQICRLGRLSDKRDQRLAGKEELAELLEIESRLPEEVKEDYFERRKTNFSLTSHVLLMVEEEIIDYFIIPLDDNSEYGFTAKEQRLHMLEIDRLNLMDRTAVYPGADEIACTLFARVFCEIQQYSPEIALRFSSANGPHIIPRYEDRTLMESIKSHITAAGGIITGDEKNNDFLLMVHSPAADAEHMAESSHELNSRHRSYFSEMNIREFIQAMKHFIGKGKKVALADVAICNGGDHSLLQQLSKQSILHSLLAYAGWNTNGNTMGTVISHAIIASYYQQGDKETPAAFNKASRSFFYSRLVEDWGYQSIVRKHISYQVLPQMGLTPRNLGGQVSEVTDMAAEKLQQFTDTYLADIPEGKVILGGVYLPWRRMFEVGFTLNLDEVPGRNEDVLEGKA